ncbi:nuclear pore complex protein NUP214-like [Castanea sativa]|uniref:nuclear pore complex protein NUP214-like n=1 Tax=Castanea sativa TaxID=21020 RepID=UPI003F65021D
MQIIGFTVRLSSSLLWIQIYRLGVSYVDTTGSREADYDLRNSFLSPATPAVVRQPSNSDYILGGSIYDPAYYSSLFEGQENRCSHGAPKTSVPLSTPISESPKTELQPPMAKSSLKTDKAASKQVSSLQSEPPKGEIESKLEPSVTTDPTIEISTRLTSGSQPSFGNMAKPAPNVTLNAQPAQPSTARVLFPTPLPTSGRTTGEKNGSLDVAETEEDEMEEEAPETSNTAKFSLGSLGAFGIGSTPTATAPKSNPFGGPFGNAASSPMSSAFDITVPSGQLFRPASFSFQLPQSSQPSQPTNSSAFSGGFSTGTTAQAPTQTGFSIGSAPNFGGPALGSGQQALGSILGSFGQSRQIGTGLPGTGFGSPSGFGGGGGFTGTSSPGGFSSAATGGGFAGVASGVAGFARVASAGGSGGFSGGGFGAFNSQIVSVFSAFSGSTGGTGKPTELFTQIRK